MKNLGQDDNRKHTAAALFPPEATVSPSHSPPDHPGY